MTIPALRRQLASALLLTCSVAAPAQDGRDPVPALREFLVSPIRGVADPPATLVKRIGTVERARALLRGLLDSPRACQPGFHLLSRTDSARPVASLLVPKSCADRAAHPMVVVSEPASLSRPPDELPLRALYSSYLEEGWMVLAPTVSPYALSKRSRPDLAALIATASFHCAIDRDRVLLVSPVAGRLDPISPLTEPYEGETTPFAGLHDVYPGTSIPSGTMELEPWSGRLIALHLSSHNPDAALLWRNVLLAREREGMLATWFLRTTALDFRGHLRLPASAVRSIAARVRRAAPPGALYFTAGGARARRHEWLEVPRLDSPLLVRARREGSAVHLATPAIPARETFVANIFLPRAEAVTVTLNDRPLFVDPAANGVREVLLLARYALQTGRQAAGVVRLRP